MNSDWSRTFRYWTLTMLAVGLTILVWFGRAAIAPLVTAALLAYALNPVVEFVARRTRLSRRVAVAVVYFASLGALAGLPALLWPVLVDDLRILAVDLRAMFVQLETFAAQPIAIFGTQLSLARLLPDLEQLSSEWVPPATESAFQLVEAATTNLIWLLVILVTTFYLLQDWPRLREWLIRLAPEPYQPDVRRIYQDIRRIWRGYLLGNLALMLVVGLMFSVAWVALGLPAALILGLLTGLFTIVPDVGPAVAAALAVLVALFGGSTYLPLSNFWFAVLVLGVYLVLINVKAIWIRPRLFGRSVELHEGVVFVAIMAAVVLQGILGALIVVPVLASAGVVGRYVLRRLYGQPPFPIAEALGAGSDSAGQQQEPAAADAPILERERQSQR